LSGSGVQVEVIDQRVAGRARLGTDGTRVVAADDDGTLSLIADEQRTTIHTETEKLRGAVLAELDPENSGLEAACAGYARRITVLRRTGGSWQSEVVHEGTDRFHHLLAVELDGRPGLELVACGYDGGLLVITRR
jgi:hypothetical protein